MQQLGYNSSWLFKSCNVSYTLRSKDETSSRKDYRALADVKLPRPERVNTCCRLSCFRDRSHSCHFHHLQDKHRRPRRPQKQQTVYSQTASWPLHTNLSKSLILRAQNDGGSFCLRSKKPGVKRIVRRCKFGLFQLIRVHPH